MLSRVGTGELLMFWFLGGMGIGCVILACWERWLKK
jgi:hypothetical protein